MPAIPTCDEVNGTGMLGAESLNGCTMSPVSRWKRLILPHGVFQLPKSLVNWSASYEKRFEPFGRSSARRHVLVGRHAGRTRPALYQLRNRLAAIHRERRATELADQR